MRFTRQNKILSLPTACLLSNILTIKTSEASILDSVYEILFSDETRGSRANHEKSGRMWGGAGSFDAYHPFWSDDYRTPEHRKDFNWTMPESEFNKDQSAFPNNMKLFSKEYRDFYMVMGEPSLYPPYDIDQIRTDGVNQHRWGWDKLEEKASKWFTHSDFTDKDGVQNYYVLATRPPAIRNAKIRLYGLNSRDSPDENPHCMNKALYPECSNSEDERVLATGDCACCNPNNEPHLRGCAMNPKDSCAHVKYTDKNGNEQKARKWCPESLDENNEVYAYVQNDVDPKFLEGDIWADFWSLGIWDMQARWWVYLNSKPYAAEIDGVRSSWDHSLYVRDDVSLGVHRRKYETIKSQNQMKRSFTCYNGVDSDVTSDWMWQPDPSDDASVAPTLDQDPDSLTYEHTLDWGSRDGARKGLLGEEVNLQLKFYKKAKERWDGLEMCASMSPQKETYDELRHISNLTMTLKWTLKECNQNHLAARPVCVIKGSDLSDTDPIKTNAVDMKAGGPLLAKYMARSQEIHKTFHWWAIPVGIRYSTWYWFKETYGFCLFFFCCCQLPCCWEGWICGKGGQVWESVLCFPCKLCCYGTLCGWRFLEKVKKEEAADLIEKARLKKIKDEEEACSSSSDSSSSDSD